MGTTTKKNNSFVLTQKDEKSEFTLIEEPLKELPKKIYGEIDKKATKILTTFKDRPTNLGVLCSGLKGNGKTLVCLMTCRMAMEQGTRIVMITEAFTGDKFKNFVNTSENTLFFIDEFEKIYNTQELQDEFLTILDGASGGKKLFLFTSNSGKISQYLKNRPNRIFYHLEYENLAESTVDDIIDKELKEKQFEQDLRELLIILGTVSFDVLLNLIDEVNRYKESPKKLIQDLNIQVEQTNFDVTMFLNGKRYKTQIEYNPLTVQRFDIDYKKPGKEGWEAWGYFNDAVSNYEMYTDRGAFIFENGTNKLVFRPYKPFKFQLQ